MKILQINCVYKSGSTGKIVYDLHSCLISDRLESVVCYGRGTVSDDKNVYKVSSELEAKIHSVLAKLFGAEFGFSWFATNKTLQIIKKEQPDIVHLHCLNGHFINVYRLLNYLKKNRIKTVLTLHAEIMYTAGCSHAMECEKWKTECHDCSRIGGKISRLFRDDARHCYREMKNAFAGFSNLAVVGVSEWLSERAKRSPMLQDKKHFVVLNGVDTEVFHPYNTDELRKKYASTGEKILFYVTPDFNNDIHHIKGGYYVIKLAEKLKNDNARVKIVVAGDYNRSLIVPENIILLGRITDQKLLAQYYSMADITILTSKKETFSMVCAESFCCGTPVVGFEAGGPESIAIPDYSRFVEYGNIDALAFSLADWLSWKSTLTGRELAGVAKEYYSKESMEMEYIGIYQGMGCVFSKKSC